MYAAFKPLDTSTHQSEHIGNYNGFKFIFKVFGLINHGRLLIIIAFRCKRCHHHRSMHALQGGHIICQSLDNTCGRCATASPPIPMLPYGFTEIGKVLSDLFNHDRVIARRTPSETGQENGGRRVERIRTKRTRPSEMKESWMIFVAPPNTRFADALDLQPTKRRPVISEELFYFLSFIPTAIEKVFPLSGAPLSDRVG